MKSNQHTDRKALEELLRNQKHPGQTPLDDFDKDALEGWKASGASLSQMAGMDKAISKSYSSFFIGKTLLFIGVAASVITTAVFLTNTTTDPIQKKPKTQLIVERSEISLPEKIDTLQELTKPVQLSSKEIIIKNKQEAQQSETKREITIINFEKFPDVALEPLPIEIENKVVTVSKQRSAKEIYLHHLKAIDYTEYRSKPEIKTEQIILSGVPANYEDYDAMGTEATTRVVLIPYADYIDKTLLYIEREKWKQALARCEEILSDYPDDLNAMFYAGFCAYNLQQYQEACNKFSACLQLNFSNFNEEASWYLAKSRLANNEKAAAKELFITIRDNKGYYSGNAAKVLKDWK